MTTWLRALWLPLAVALAAPAPSSAQASAPPRQRAFDPATVTTFQGEIVDIQRIPRGRRYEGVHLILQAGADRLDVHLGPDAYVDRQEPKLEKGDQVEVKGSRIQLDGTDVVIAQEVRKGDETLVLRNAQGVPAWSRGRR